MTPLLQALLSASAVACRVNSLYSSNETTSRHYQIAAKKFDEAAEFYSRGENNEAEKAKGAAYESLAFARQI